MPKPTPDIPEEAVEALVQYRIDDYMHLRDQVVAELERAAPAIRKQERERVRSEVVSGPVERAFAGASGADLTAAAYLRGINAALDTLEDSGGDEDCDDLCTCGHERFHHDDGREMGVLTHCKAKACTCKQFVPDSNTREEAGG